MNRRTQHRRFTAEDAVRIALGAFYNASLTAKIHAEAATPPPQVSEGASALPPLPALPATDAAWFLGQWMESISNKLRDDRKTARHYAEIIRRWEAEDSAAENARFAPPDNRQHNAGSGRS
jgi:hypothetical protein